MIMKLFHSCGAQYGSHKPNAANEHLRFAFYLILTSLNLHSSTWLVAIILESPVPENLLKRSGIIQMEFQRQCETDRGLAVGRVDAEGDQALGR